MWRPDTLKRHLDNLLQGADNLETAAVSLAAKVAPWLAPVPTAWLIWDRTVARFRWPWTVGLSAALAVEALGLVTTITGLHLYTYQCSKRKTDPDAPLFLAAGLVGLYVLTAELLVVGLDVLSHLGSLVVVDWVPAIFPLLSVAGMAILAVRYDHRQRLDSIEVEKSKARQARQEARQARQETEGECQALVADRQEIETMPSDINNVLDKPVAMAMMLDIYRDNPRARAVEVARHLGRSRQTVYTYLDELSAAGRMRKNGDGWVVEE